MRKNKFHFVAKGLESVSSKISGRLSASWLQQETEKLRCQGGASKNSGSNPRLAQFGVHQRMFQTVPVATSSSCCLPTDGHGAETFRPSAPVPIRTRGDGRMARSAHQC